MSALTLLDPVEVACCADETWAPIPGWPHEASTCGRARSVDRLGADGIWRLGALLPPQEDKRPGKGYLYYDLRDGTRRRRIPAAVAVLEAHDRLRPGPEFEACHGNDVRTDNHAVNLTWDTKAANLAKMWEQRRLKAVTDTGAGLSQEGLRCHSPQVRWPAGSSGVLSRATVTGDSFQGTLRSPVPHFSPSSSSSLKPFFRTLRTPFRTLRFPRQAA